MISNTRLDVRLTREKENFVTGLRSGKSIAWRRKMGSAAGESKHCQDVRLRDGAGKPNGATLFQNLPSMCMIWSGRGLDAPA